MINNKIHPSVIVSNLAIIGVDVEIGPFTVIHDNVEIKNGTIIGSFCEIGIPTLLAKKTSLLIGENCVIRSHSTIYSGSVIGKNFHSGHYVSIRENSSIGENCQLGNRGDIQGDCEIGNFTKMHADVHVGKKSKIGNYVWLFPEVLLTNDPVPPSNILKGVIVEDFVVLASKVLVLPGVVIGKDSVVSAGAVVKDNVEPGKLVGGSPAREICNANILRMPDNPKIKAYPWRKRFSRGYPEAMVVMWLKEFEGDLN